MTKYKLNRQNIENKINEIKIEDQKFFEAIKPDDEEIFRTCCIINHEYEAIQHYQKARMYADKGLMSASMTTGEHGIAYETVAKTYFLNGKWCSR